MDDRARYDLALSFWSASLQYLMLVENVSKETTSQGNTWVMTSAVGHISEEEYEEGTRWSDHTIILPLLFNLYHGIELLLKGFLHVKGGKVEATHDVQTLSEEFAQSYPNETLLIDFFSKYTEDTLLPSILKQFLEDNELSFKNLYEALRYPSDLGLRDTRDYAGLMYKSKKGSEFFQELHNDIKAVRGPAVKLGRSFEPPPAP